MKYISKKGQHLQKHKRSFSKHTTLEQCVALFLCFFMLVGFFPDIVQAVDPTKPTIESITGDTLALKTGKVTIAGNDYALNPDAEYELDNLTAIPNITVSMEYTFEITAGQNIKKGDKFYFNVPQDILPSTPATVPFTDSNNSSTVYGQVIADSDGVALEFTTDESEVYAAIADTTADGGLKNAHAKANWAMRLDDDLVGSGNEVKFELAGAKFTLKFPDMSASRVDATKTGTLSDDKKIIDWTVTLTPNGNAQEGLIFEDTFADQTYVADSFKINETATTDALDTSNDGTLKYTFANALNTYESNGKIIIAYQTKVKDSAFVNSNVLKTDKEITLLNTADLKANGVDSVLTGGAVTADVRIDNLWVSKTGTVNVQDRTITWTLTVNPNRRTLNNVVLHDTMDKYLTMKTDTVKSGSSKDDCNTDIDASKISGSTLSNESKEYTIQLEDLTDTRYIQYVTDIAEDYYSNAGTEQKKLTNSAYITFGFNGIAGLECGREDVGVDAGQAPIQKSGTYDRATHTITWKIIVNSAKINITNATVTDTIETGQTFVAESVVVDNLQENDIKPNDSNVLTVVLGDSTKDKQVVITYETTVDDENHWAYNNATEASEQPEYTNTATLDATYATNTSVHDSATAAVKIPSNVLQKKLGTYNYETKTIPCTLTVNENKMPMDNGVVTDTLAEGLSVDVNSIKLDNINLSTLANSSGTFYSYDANTRELMVTLGTAADKKECKITFDIKADVDALAIENRETKKEFKIKNDAKLERTDHTSTTVTASDSATVTSPIVTKKSNPKNNEALIEYSVLINQIGLNLDNIQEVNVLKDTLGGSQTLDAQSIVLERGHVNAVGEFASETTLTAFEDYTYTATEKTLTLQLPRNAGSYAYRLTYAADVEASGELTNAIAFNSEMATNSQTTSTVNISGAGGGGVLTRKAQLEITQQSTDGTPLAGAEFTLYDDKGNAIAILTTDNAGLAKVRMKAGNYTLRETKAPDSYALSAKEYKITVEQNGSAFKILIDGIETSDKKMTVTNVKMEDVGDLSISKTLSGNDTKPDDDFTFTVALEKDSTPIAGSTYDYIGTNGKKNGSLTFDNGQASFTLQGGQSITIHNLPKDYEYTVTEAASDYIISKTGDTGKIAVGTPQTAAFTNTKNKIVPTPTPNPTPNPTPTPEPTPTPPIDDTQGGGSSGGDSGSDSPVVVKPSVPTLPDVTPAPTDVPAVPVTQEIPTTPTTPDTPDTPEQQQLTENPENPATPQNPALSNDINNTPTDYDYPTYESHNMPDANDADSPEVFYLVDENGVPLGMYVKQQNDDGTYEYIFEEMPPLAGLSPTPQTGDALPVVLLIFIFVLSIVSSLYLIYRRKCAK